MFSAEWRVGHFILSWAGEQVQVRNLCPSCFWELSSAFAPLVLWHGSVLRGHVLLQQFIPFSLCTPAALGAGCLRAYYYPFSLLVVLLEMENCHLWGFFFFSKLFSGGLVSWECARDVEMLLQKVGFPGKC